MEIGDENEPPSCDISGDQEQGTQNGLSNAFDNNGNGSSLPAKIELLKILNTVKAPHNLNDYIMGWAKLLLANMMLILVLNLLSEIRTRDRTKVWNYI